MAENQAHEKKVIASAVSADGTLVATADLDSRIVVHKLLDGQEVARFDDKAARRIIGLAIHPEGNRLFSATQYTLRAYAIPSGEQLADYSTGVDVHKNDNWQVITSSGRTKRATATWIDGSVRSMALTYDGQWLAAVVNRKSEPNGLVVWGVESRDIVASDGDVSHAVISPEESVVAVQKANGTSLYQLPSLVFRRHLGSGKPIGFSLDGKYVFVQDRSDQKTKVYVVEDGRLHGKADYVAREAMISANGKIIIMRVGSTAIAWNLATDKELWKFRMKPLGASPSFANQPHISGVLLASLQTRQPDIALLDLSSGKVLGGVELGPVAISTLHSADGSNRFVVSVYKKKTKFYVTPSRKK